MAVEGRDFGDSEILQKTMREADGGKVRFKTTLPSGRELSSEWMPAEESKKVVMAWCENVRQQIDFDVREEELRKKRDRDLSEEVTQTTKEEAADEAVSPVEYAVHQRDMYIARAEVLEERLHDTEVELKRVREHLEQWNVIVHKLRGETDE